MATRSQDDDKRLCLVDDLKEAHVYIQVKLIRTSSRLKSKITTSCPQDEMGTFRETLAEGNEGALHLGLERARVYYDLSPDDKDRYNADIRATNILLQGLPKDIYTLINHYTDAKDIWDNVKILLEGSELTKEDRESQLYDDFKHFHQNKGETIHDYYVRFSKLINNMRNIKMTMPRMQLNSTFVNNMLPEWGRFVTTVKLNKGLKESNYDKLVDRTEVRGTIQGAQVQLVMKGFKTELGMKILVKLDRLSVITAIVYDILKGTALNPSDHIIQITSKTRCGHDTAVDEDVDEPLVQDLALNVDNVFQDDDYDAFDFDVDEAPTTQTMFMVNLSSADPVDDEASPSYDSDILFEYVKDNVVPVVQSNVSFVPNDAYMMIMHEHTAQSFSANEQNKVVNASLTAELATYKEQVKLIFQPSSKGFEVKLGVLAVFIDLHNIHPTYLFLTDENTIIFSVLLIVRRRMDITHRAHFWKLLVHLIFFERMEISGSFKPWKVGQTFKPSSSILQTEGTLYIHLSLPVSDPIPLYPSYSCTSQFVPMALLHVGKSTKAQTCCNLTV
ncbi:hypothetical protein Tco_1569802 [Tanacetum coccineum]